MTTKYLCIENPKVCPIEGFTILGVSSARGKDGKIGQFGSGCKHAVNLLLRKNLTPVIFTGENRLTFYTKEGEMDGTKYQRVYVNMEPLAFATGFGELDWKDIGMALREFISNAFDNGGCNLTWETRLEGKPGCTRIYVQGIPEVEKYIRELPDNFLQFDGRHTRKILPPMKKDAVRLYRRGVFVVEVPIDGKRKGEASHHCWDYNIDFEIDEARNFSPYQAENLIKNTLLFSDPCLEQLMRHCDNLNLWELHKLDAYPSEVNRCQEIQALWKSVYKEMPVTYSVEVHDLLTKKGIPCKMTTFSFFRLLIRCGVTDGRIYLSTAERNGYKEIPVNPECINTFDSVWKALQDLSMVSEEAKKPTLGMYLKHNNGNTNELGFYDPGENRIFISEECASNYQTMLEECCHAITQAQDLTRDFQEFAFKVGARAIRRYLELKALPLTLTPPDLLTNGQFPASNLH